jgi:limonene 1,2-monooxygenase
VRLKGAVYDVLGFDEAYIGEHHTAGWETIASPEVFIAAAAGRTRYIRLGTGVVSLPYHHPYMVASRMVLLDHLTRGRAILGVGPGALSSDAYMLGIDPAHQSRGPSLVSSPLATGPVKEEKQCRPAVSPA